MIYIEELRKSREKHQVAFQEFALSTRRLPKHLFCFFEGKDNAYYIPRIKRFTNEYHPILCGGREKVLHVYHLIISHNEYERYKKAFFIDRDFNEPLVHLQPPIFETPCYSIENLYVSVDVFKEILTNSFHLSEIGDQEIFDACMSHYEARQKEFHQATTLFNAWYACLIDRRNTEGIQTGVELEDKFPKDFIEITLSAVSQNYDLDKIKQTFPNAIDIEEEKLNAKMEIFQNCEQHRLFRGKFEMQFLIKFIQLLLQDGKSTKIVLKEKVNFTFGDASGLNNEQAINIFSAYAETPDTLLAYLQEVTQAFP
ncbi:MAG: DUF4435 domain-containing protein [Microscillaceae bacterium]|nr:DUF4435 domain-containing protein [Microscillaceae bacterium]